MVVAPWASDAQHINPAKPIIMFFRVLFIGAAFGQLNGVSFVYKEPVGMRLIDLRRWC